MTDPITQYRKKEASRQIRWEAAELVYNYPQYTLEDVLEMPDGDRRLLLNYARLHDAESRLHFAVAVASPHSKSGPKKHIEHLEGVIKNLAESL